MASVISVIFSKDEAAAIVRSWSEAGYTPESEYPPHVTLIYDDDENDLRELVYALPQKTLTGKVGGGAIQFDTEDGVAYAASVDLVGLAQTHVQLKDSMPDSFVAPYDFTPHATIQFGGQVEGNLPQAVQVSARWLLVSTGEDNNQVFDLELGTYTTEHQAELRSVSELYKSYSTEIIKVSTEDLTVSEASDEALTACGCLVEPEAEEVASSCSEDNCSCTESLTAETDEFKLEVAAFEIVPEPGRWVAILAVEEEQTPDFRLLRANSLEWRTPPLSLMMNFEGSHGGVQAGSKIVGLIEEIYRDGLKIMATGRFDSSEWGREAERLVAEGIVSGISIDLAPQDAVIEVLAEDELGNPTSVLKVVERGIILAATITPMQAVTSAKIFMAASTEETTDGMRMSTEHRSEEGSEGDGDSFSGASTAADHGAAQEGSREGKGRVGLVAAAGRQFNSKFFEDPQFTGRTPLTVLEDGRILGHAAVWGACHIGMPDNCTFAPTSFTDYAYFRLGEVRTEKGVQSVGVLTMGSGHANDMLSPQAALAHYDNVGTVAAYVNIGEDAHGIWVSGSVAGHLNEDDITKLSACSVSGDWRLVNGNFELVALLAVPVPGFPVARMRDGEQISLVAAGYGPVLPDAPLSMVEAAPSKEAYEALAQRLEHLEAFIVPLMEAEALAKKQEEEAAERELIEALSLKFLNFDTSVFSDNSSLEG